MADSEGGVANNSYVDDLVASLLAGDDDVVIAEGSVGVDDFVPIALAKPPNPLPDCIAALPLKPPTVSIDGVSYWICQYTGQPIVTRVGIPDAKVNGHGYTMRGAFADWNCARTWLCQRKFDNQLTDEEHCHYIANINAAAGAPVGNTSRKSSLVTWGGNTTPQEFRSGYTVYLSGNQSLGATSATMATSNSSSPATTAASTPRASAPHPPRLSFYNVEGGRVPESAGNKASFGKALVSCFEPKATHLAFRGVYLPQADAIYFKTQGLGTVPKSVSSFLSEKTGKEIAHRAADAKLSTPLAGSIGEGLLMAKVAKKRNRKSASAPVSGTATPKKEKTKATKKQKTEDTLAAASAKLNAASKPKKAKKAKTSDGAAQESKGAKAVNKQSKAKSSKPRTNIAKADNVFIPPPPSAIVSVGAN